MGRGPEIRTPVVITDTGIGGGHLTFGLEVERSLERIGINSQCVSADTLSDPRSFLSLSAFRFLYEQGSQGKIRQNIYEHIRGQSNRDSLPVRFVKNALTQELSGYNGAIVAAHSYSAVKQDGPLFLIQGDVHSGKDYAVADADLIVTTTDTAVNELVAHGIAPDRIRKVGFFVDEGVRNPENTDRRIGQLRGDERMHVGIFFTGALPQSHLRLAKEILVPELAPLMKKNRVQLTVYTFTSQKEAHEFVNLGRSLGVKMTLCDDNAANGTWDMRIIYGTSTREAVERSLDAVGNVTNPISLLVTMPGERIGWTVGVALAPFPPINHTNAGGNTQWGIINGLFLPPSMTRNLTRQIQDGPERFVEQIKIGKEFIDPRGGLRTSEEIAKKLSGS